MLKLTLIFIKILLNLNPSKSHTSLTLITINHTLKTLKLITLDLKYFYTSFQYSHTLF